MTGSVVMDDLADRVPNLAAFYVPPNGRKISKIVNISSQLKKNCDGIVDKSNCYNLVRICFSKRVDQLRPKHYERF